MALGNSNNIIVGAAQLWIADAPLAVGGNPAPVSGTKYSVTMDGDTDFRSVGYTMNGLELQFQPDFGEVQVDQVLDVAKLFKQGMQVNLNTTFAESTLENLLVAVAGLVSGWKARATEAGLQARCSKNAHPRTPVRDSPVRDSPVRDSPVRDSPVRGSHTRGLPSAARLFEH